MLHSLGVLNLIWPVFDNVLRAPTVSPRAASDAMDFPFTPAESSSWISCCTDTTASELESLATVASILTVAASTLTSGVVTYVPQWPTCTGDVFTSQTF